MKPNTKTIYHIVIHSPEHSEAVQKRLFELGYKWAGGETDVCMHTIGHISLNYRLVGKMTRDASKNPVCDTAKTITLDDLYRPEFCKPQSIEVKLNEQHTAIVHKDKIVVGCQTFPPSIIDDLVKAWDEVKE